MNERAFEQHQVDQVVLILECMEAQHFYYYNELQDFYQSINDMYM